MNRLFALALGAVLAASAGPALAASPVEFEGYVRVFHQSLSNMSRSTDGDYQDRDNFFENKLQISVTFRPNDQVSVFWQFRGPNYQRWGVTGNVAGNARDQTNIFTRALYGEVVFPWGTIRGGRLLDGLAGTAGGLTSLGYNPSWGGEFLYANPFDTGAQLDGLTYTQKWDNGFGLAVYYVKVASLWPEPDGDRGNPDRFGLVADDDFYLSPGCLNSDCDFYFKDNDHDAFGVEGSYEWDGGGATLGVEYHRDLTDPRVEKNYAVFVSPSVYQSWGPFAVHFEGQIGWGRLSYSRLFSAVYSNPDMDNVERSAGLGLYLDGVYNYGPGEVTLAAWFADGTAIDDQKSHDLVGMGDFAPFLVAYYDVTLGTGAFSNTLGGYGLTNQFGIGILGKHSVTPEIALNYGLGFFRLVNANVPWFTFVNGQPVRVEQSKDLGWEIDLGATFQILDNLSFETQFGYMFNGKAYDEPTWDANGAITGWESAKDSFVWANVLAFTF
jgi:hypothetical protein